MKKKRVKRGVVRDLIALVIFSVLTFCLLGTMIVRGLSLKEIALLFSFAILANGSLCNVIEE